jgi:carbon-monoxide dehydrogenase large subunit
MRNNDHEMTMQITPTPDIEGLAIGRNTQKAYIGSAVVRPNAKRHLEGRGVYVDDLTLPRLAHVVYLRSPLAHARIGAIDAQLARTMPGIIAIVNGKEIAAICTPWTATLAHLAGGACAGHRRRDASSSGRRIADYRG